MVEEFSIELRVPWILISPSMLPLFTIADLPLLEVMLPLSFTMMAVLSLAFMVPSLTIPPSLPETSPATMI
ncbi:hypothetical protein [Campylobacter hepaticus]|uniref:hypothetical protein n=1 Tax=Campylobacter hepaticus TaxID=1813019 RepID=UPI00128C7EB3|nr:hypothetical protein [Campylobacter hepaticus]